MVLVVIVFAFRSVVVPKVARCHLRDRRHAGHDTAPNGFPILSGSQGPCCRHHAGQATPPGTCPDRGVIATAVGLTVAAQFLARSVDREVVARSCLLGK